MTGHGLLALGSVAITILLLPRRYVAAVLRSGGMADGYFYADAASAPAVSTTWPGDSPATKSDVLPLGILGGLGLFTLLVLEGLSADVALCWDSRAVRTMVLACAGAWLMRFWYAVEMIDSGLAQLYPRSGSMVLHCALVARPLRRRPRAHGVVPAHGSPPLSSGRGLSRLRHGRPVPAAARRLPRTAGVARP